MKHALFVAFHYPPEASSSGVLRTLKYTRYLGHHGWRVTVLTVRCDAYAVQDPALEAQIPATVRVIRTPYLNTKRHLAVRGLHLSLLAIPDAFIGWWPWAVSAGRRVIREDPVDVIYSTSPHPTAHLIAWALRKRAKIPWVSDFRDPWYEEPPEAGTSRIAHLAARTLERHVVRRSARVIGSTRRLRNMLASRYPTEPSEKFVAIANGYDEDDFKGAVLLQRTGAHDMVILHAGAINPYFRDPRQLFTAIRDAARPGFLDPGRIHLRFLGAGPFAASSEIAQALADTGLAGQVEFRPRLPYAQALEEMAAADLLLLLQTSSDTADLVPAKLFEYLRSDRPVLAVTGNGATREIMEEAGGGWVADPRDLSALQESLVTAYRSWNTGALQGFAARRERVCRFSRRHLAGALAAHLDAVLKHHAVK